MRIREREPPGNANKDMGKRKGYWGWLPRASSAACKEA